MTRSHCVGADQSHGGFPAAKIRSPCYLMGRVNSSSRPSMLLVKRPGPTASQCLCQMDLAQGCRTHGDELPTACGGAGKSIGNREIHPRPCLRKLIYADRSDHVARGTRQVQPDRAPSAGGRSRRARRTRERRPRRHMVSLKACRQRPVKPLALRPPKSPLCWTRQPSLAMAEAHAFERARMPIKPVVFVTRKAPGPHRDADDGAVRTCASTCRTRDGAGTADRGGETCDVLVPTVHRPDRRRRAVGMASDCA